jgi:ABC-type transport system involved in multi-copper enzyme maturation permease subunit
VSAGLIAFYAIRETLRRRVFQAVLVLTVVFLILYWLGARFIFAQTRDFPGGPLNEGVVRGASVFGLALFATYFLGSVLAIFLTLGAIRGEAERGLLQPLVARPLGRSSLVAGRLAAAVAVCVPYTAVVYLNVYGITRRSLHWTPDRPLEPLVALAVAVTIVAAISLLGSVFLAPIANGITIFMVLGIGFVAGLLGQIGVVMKIHSLERIAELSAWFAPFEALYERAVYSLTADTSGITKTVLSLGPFGGPQPGPGLLWLWSVVYLGLVVLVTLVLFARRDL